MSKAKRRKEDGDTAEDSGGDAPRSTSNMRARVLTLAANALAASVWVVLGIGLIIGYFALSLPAVDVDSLARRPNIKIFDADNWEVASFGDFYGAAIDPRDLPPHIPAAVVAVEDRRFYEHPGVDLRALARALYRGVSEDIPGGTRMEGGSTITQQVAKNLFLTSERTIARKIKEALLALKLENAYSKDEILALYMNRMYFGGGIYGFEAASERFFDRPAKDLTVFQAAVLTGMLKAPSHYNPARDPERAKERAQLVLATMVETGALTEAQAAAALKSADKTLKNVISPTANARYFADWILSQVESYVGTVDRDLVVKTTLDGRLQSRAETALSKHLDKSGEKLRVEQGAVVVMRPDGAVRAMVGGKDYAESQFNRATQALRQPGSAFKPFVYLAGLEAGYGPDDMVTDAPIKIGKWKPQNFTNKYLGAITVEHAFSESVNTAAVRVAQHAGAKAVVATAHRLGISEKLKPELSLALGSAEVTLLELTGAYAPFANGGDAVIPYAITSISDRDGNVLYQRESGGLGEVVAPHELAVMNRMMREVLTTGTGTAAAFGYPAAGKTGTTNDFRDAWFMGFTADYVTGVWVGNDSGKGMKAVTGGGLPAHIWREVMTAAHDGRAPRNLPGLEPPPSEDFLGRFWEVITGSDRDRE